MFRLAFPVAHVRSLLCAHSVVHERAHHGLDVAKLVGDSIGKGLGYGVVDKIAEVWNSKKLSRDVSSREPCSAGGHLKREIAAEHHADSSDTRRMKLADGPAIGENLAFEKREDDGSAGEWSL